MPKRKKPRAYTTYKKIMTNGIPWVICPKHNEAHPLDFPCRGCSFEQKEKQGVVVV